MKLTVAQFDGDSEVFSCPDLENKSIPKGWELKQKHFVDNSGFGAKDEPALTPHQFLAKVKKGKGYAIVEKGQFQVYVGEFEKVVI